MKFLDLMDIAERYLDLINPASPEKILILGSKLRLNQESRVIDYGCGFGETLALWGEQFGITGTGIDIRPYACERARQRLARANLSGNFEIICMDGSAYPVEAGSYDVALCVGASFIWGGFQQSIHAVQHTIHSAGRIVIGEPYWATDHAPPDYVNRQSGFHTEYELLQIARQAGFDFEYMVRASHDDWDRYQAGNWYGLVRWLEENRDHPERAQVIEHLHTSQDEYLRYGRQFFGWAIYVLSPAMHR